LDRLATAGAALFLLVFGFLPLANWIAGGHGAPWYEAVAMDLLIATGVAVGAGVVVGILTRKITWPAAPFPWNGSAPVFALAILALVLYLTVSRVVFSGKPLLIDEIMQVLQARVLAAGRLWTDAEPHQFFFSSLHLVELEGRVFAQFPMGGPAMLALGSLVRAEWVATPVFGALSVVVFGLLVRRTEARKGTALLATGIFGLAPFAVFMAGSHMNHVTTLFWLLVGMLGLARATGEEKGEGRGWLDGLLCGLGFGMAATIRPADAAAFAIPAAAWLLVRAIRGGGGAGGGDRRHGVPQLLGAGLGILVPVAVLCWTNLETTGAPLRFGYTVLWGSAHDLGFHATPWGFPHSPARGLELINIYFLRLQSYLFEAGLPSLLPAGVALAVTRRIPAFDRYLLGSGALLVALYFAYWHDGFYLGPRFLYPLLPLLVLWTARLPAVLKERAGPGVHRTAVATLIVAAGLGLATSFPIRVAQYRGGLLSLRWDPDRAAQQAGVRGALVLVRESWGAELVARLWAIGVSRSDAETLYREADPCRLESGLTALEASGLRGDAATRALQPLRADSVRPAQSEAITGDPTLRLTPGVTYPPHCMEKINANLTGFTLFPPLLLARDHDNVYARDLGAKDSLLLTDYPDRPVYLLKPDSRAVGAEPVFHRLNRDSLLTVWRAGR